MKKMIALFSSLLILTSSAAGALPVQAARHTSEATWEHEWTEAEVDEYLRDKYYLGEDGVFYSKGSGEWFYDRYTPAPGTFDRTVYLRALLKKYPEGRFYVQLEGWVGPDYYDEEFRPEVELERLRQNGVEASGISERYALHFSTYAVLTADQLEEFPVDEMFGYFIGLAPRPLTGDINLDGMISLSDVVALNKHLMIGQYIPYEAQCVADVDKNGIIDETDSLNILKSIIGLVDLNELG